MTSKKLVEEGSGGGKERQGERNVVRARGKKKKKKSREKERKRPSGR